MPDGRWVMDVLWRVMDVLWMMLIMLMRMESNILLSLPTVDPRPR
jgi:hypothetical protein